MSNSVATPTLREDRYPSRVKEQPEFFDRRDPVVYGSAADGPLTAEELSFYERRGYLSFGGFFESSDLAPFLKLQYHACAAQQYLHGVQQRGKHAPRTVLRIAAETAFHR